MKSTFLYSCYQFSQGELLGTILEIFSDIPYAFQIMRCQSTTSLEELSLFLKRLQTIKGDYIIIDANKLSFLLQVCSTYFVGLCIYFMYSCSKDYNSI